MRLGGSPNISEGFPDKPKGIHWQTFERLRRAHDVAESLSMTGCCELSIAGIDEKVPGY